jgi:hypothetical protein
MGEWFVKGMRVTNGKTVGNGYRLLLDIRLRGLMINI